MISFIDLNKQYNEISNYVEVEIIDCLRKGHYTGSYYLERFERALGGYLQANHVIGTSSGTDAAMVACEALGIGKGDFVIVPNNSFISPAFGITRAGATPIFVDVNPDTYLIDEEKTEKILKNHPKKKRIKAILIVSLYGQLPNMETFKELSYTYKVRLIEDNTHALSTTHKNNSAGSYSDISIASLNPTKSLGAIGQAGVIITDDINYARKARLIINQGSEKKHYYTCIGGDYRLDAIMSIHLYHALNRIDDWTNRRRRIAKLYNESFTSDQRPTQQPCSKHVYHFYEFKCKNKNERETLEREFILRQISYGIHYPNLISETPMYEDAETPVAYELKNRLISLPMHPFLTEAQAQHVIHVVQSVV